CSIRSASWNSGHRCSESWCPGSIVKFHWSLSFRVVQFSGGRSVLAAEVGDDALPDLAVFAVGFDDADVFVDGAAGGADFDGPGIHGRLQASEEGRCPATHRNHYHDGLRRDQG